MGLYGDEEEEEVCLHLSLCLMSYSHQKVHIVILANMNWARN